MEKESELRLQEESSRWKAQNKGEIRHSLAGLLTTGCVNFSGVHARRGEEHAVQAP